jgi:hypothetical protein
MERLADEMKFYFLDEKHLINKDILPNKTQADPLTEYMDAIKVRRSDFCETYNLLAKISAKAAKPLPIHDIIGKENGNSASFVFGIYYATNFLLLV